MKHSCSWSFRLLVSPWGFSGGLRDQLNLATQVIDPSYQAQDDLLAVAASEVVGAEIFVFAAILEHVIGGGGHGRSDGEDGFFRSGRARRRWN